MKKFLILLFSLSLAFALVLTGCIGSYTPPIITEKPNTGNEKDPPGGGNTGGDTEGKIIFTVTLMENGLPFEPPADSEIYAQWTGEDGRIYDALFNGAGVAQAELDGDYRVNLSNLPSNYTYNPNGLYADNDHRNVTIALLKIERTTTGTTRAITQTGNYPGVCTKVSKLGTYRAIIQSNRHYVYYQYAPTQPGTYYVQSWVDVTANEVNPIMDHYTASTQYLTVASKKTFDTGSTKGTYTKNFRFTVNCDYGYVGNVWVFALYAGVREDTMWDTEYGGVVVDFTITYEGEPNGEYGPPEVIEAYGPFCTDIEKLEPAGIFRYDYIYCGMRLDETRFKKNTDGFYYRYDDVEYAATDGWGPMLFAMIGADCAVIKQQAPTAKGKGFWDERYIEILGKTNPDEVVRTFNVSYVVGEGKKVKDFRRFVDKYYGYNIDTDSYPEGYLNQDYAHPVNDEIRQFLQDIAIGSEMFFDGVTFDGGYLGKAEAFGLKADHDSMWLFACGYYK